MPAEVVNPILPQFVDKLDPQFVEIYNREQGKIFGFRRTISANIATPAAPRLRADQVSIEEYRANPSKYTLSIAPGPKPEVASAVIHHVQVDQPKGQIKVKVYQPTEDAIHAGGLKTSAGLPAHVNYHGG